MAKQTIKSSLFDPTGPVQQAPTQVPAEPIPAPTPEKELTHNTSTRIPLTVHEYFERLAVEHGYSTHSLRIYAMAWFVKEHKAGTLTLERDRTVTNKRALAIPEID